MISVDDIKTWITTQSSAIPQLLYFKNKRTKLELADSVYSKNDIQTVNYEQLAFLGFVGEGLFHGLYWKKLYLCNRNQETDGSAQAGCSGCRDKSKNYDLRRTIMIELYLTQNNNSKNEAYGKHYPRVSYKQTLNIHDMAVHMAEHNTPFSEGTIEGILRDFVKCTREQTLMGNTVKVDNLAIFKVSVIGNGCSELYDPTADKTITASIGTLGKNDKTGPAVNSLKLLAQATGEYTREELNKDGKLGWTDKAAAEIAAAKVAAQGSNGGSDNSGSQSGNGGSSQNQGDSENQGGSQAAQSYVLTINKTGSGSASVTKDGNAVTSGASLNEDDEVEVSITPAEGKVPTATLNGSSIELTESGGAYTGNFAMPGQASTLVINTGSAGGGGNDEGGDAE